MIYVGRLTYRQPQELKRFARHAVGREAFRAHMVLLSSRGYSVPQTAEIYDCDRDAVRAWLKKYLAKGIDGLRDAERPGRPLKGGKPARWALSRAVDVNPTVFGPRVTNWTAKALRAIFAPFGVRLSIFTVRGLLLCRLGFLERKLAKNFIAFLEALCSEVPTGPILVILDNNGTHKAKAVREWLKSHPRLHLLWLPKYTPHLNAVETTLP